MIETTLAVIFVLGGGLIIRIGWNMLNDSVGWGVYAGILPAALVILMGAIIAGSGIWGLFQ